MRDMLTVIPRVIPRVILRYSGTPATTPTLGCKADSLHLQPRFEHNTETDTGTDTGTDMRTLYFTALGIALLIQPLYLSLTWLSSTLAKYNYCYDTAMAAKYYLPKPDFTEYSLKSEPECKK